MKNRKSQKKMTVKKEHVLSDWDNDFIVQLSLVPKNIITIKTAQKILFIGKATRILLKEQEILGQTIGYVSEEIENL